MDRKRLGKSPTPMVKLAVGAHALRVTHPEHRDYVRFVDIGFGIATPVDVQLEKFAAVESSVESTAKPQPGGPITYVDRPPVWYRRWWAAARTTWTSTSVVASTVATAIVTMVGAARSRR